MTAPTAADVRVAGWFTLRRPAASGAGTLWRCRSGGFFVELDGVFPTWRGTEDEARDLLFAAGLPADGPVAEFEPSAP